MVTAGSTGRMLGRSIAMILRKRRGGRAAAGDGTRPINHHKNRVDLKGRLAVVAVAAVYPSRLRIEDHGGRSAAQEHEANKDGESDELLHGSIPSFDPLTLPELQPGEM